MEKRVSKNTVKFFPDSAKEARIITETTLHISESGTFCKIESYDEYYTISIEGHGATIAIRGKYEIIETLLSTLLKTLPEVKNNKGFIRIDRGLISAETTTDIFTFIDNETPFINIVYKNGRDSSLTLQGHNARFKIYGTSTNIKGLLVSTLEQFREAEEIIICQSANQ